MALPSDSLNVQEPVADRVRKIIAEHLGFEISKLADDASFVVGLGADSLDLLELVMAFEEAFGCQIDDDDADAIVTVGDAIRLVEAQSKTEC
jgi:acyl carrier protein